MLRRPPTWWDEVTAGSEQMPSIISVHRRHLAGVRTEGGRVEEVAVAEEVAEVPAVLMAVQVDRNQTRAVAAPTAQSASV